MAKFEILNRKTVNGNYTAGNTVENEMKKQGIEITNSDSYSEPRMAAVLSQRAKFQDLFERYCEIRENEPEICFNPSIERQINGRNELSLSPDKKLIGILPFNYTDSKSR